MDRTDTTSVALKVVTIILIGSMLAAGCTFLAMAYYKADLVLQKLEAVQQTSASLNSCIDKTAKSLPRGVLQ